MYKESDDRSKDPDDRSKEPYVMYKESDVRSKEPDGRSKKPDDSPINLMTSIRNQMLESCMRSKETFGR
jgi:hypothetical protein